MAENENTDSTMENYCKEYEVVASTWRFFVSLRFIVAAFAVTLHSALFTLYNQSFQQQTKFGEISILIIPLVGVMAISSIFLIERRTINLYLLMLRRGMELEIKLGLEDAHFRRLSEPYISRPSFFGRFISHTAGIYMLYVGTLILWMVLEFLSIWVSLV